MEFFLQQEGSLGLILFIAALLVGLLYLILPVFIWRIWYWSRQNSRQLEDLNINLKLLIRDIAPDALPPEKIAEEETTKEAEAVGELATAGMASISESGESDLLSRENSDYDFSDESASDDSMDFSLTDEFEDISDDLATSQIADFTGETDEEDTAEADRAQGAVQDEDEFVMGFDEDEDDSVGDETAGAFTEDQPVSAAPEEQEEPDDFFTTKPSPAPPTEVSVSDGDFSEFTVEHFESNEEKSFEFEDVDDDFFSSDADSTDEEETRVEGAEARADTGPESGESFATESTTEDIWGDDDFFGRSEKNKPATDAAAETNSDFSFGMETETENRDESPEPQKEDVGDVANSFLSDLEKKLNLDAMGDPSAAGSETTSNSSTPPEPAKSEPERKPEPEQPAPSQSTLFARCEGCGHKLAYKQALSGKRVRCPACRTAFTLP